MVRKGDRGENIRKGSIFKINKDKMMMRQK
jgi:hypothetical protein